MTLKWILGACGGLALAGLGSAPASAAVSCESLAGFRSGDMTITLAATVTDAASVAPALAQAKVQTPFCRVAGFITPVPDSRIGFEVWLPAEGAWNRKLQAVGNGGLAGFLNHRAMLPGFGRGYATLTTDLGHTNTPAGATEDATWALGHPEKVIDYAYRGQHLATLSAKAIVKAYYGAGPAYAYYTGCSAGGIKGLQQVLRFPDDFDGYALGAATPDHLGQQMAALWNTLAASLAEPAEALQPSQVALLHKEVLKQCAGKDGGAPSDPFLTNPAACRFEPKALQCSAGQDAAACLSPAQINIVRKIYQGPVNPRTGAPIYVGLTPGTEAGWDRYFTGKTNPAGPDRPWGGFLTSIVYEDPQYLPSQKYLSFDFDKDYEAAKRKKVAGETLESSWITRNRDLSAFAKRGGKLIQYHGWDDPNIPALAAVKLYEEVVAEQARGGRLSRAQAEAATQQFYRLFLATGTGHCTGGAGASSFGQNGQAPLMANDPEYDVLLALERWVEQGAAPEKFIGSRVDAKTKAVDMTRPICAYPKAPAWNGSGDPALASSFACVIPTTRTIRAER